jgi:hypothetical protein
MFVHLFSLNSPVIIFKSLQFKLVSRYVSGKEYCPDHHKEDQQGLERAGIAFGTVIE